MGGKETSYLEDFLVTMGDSEAEDEPIADVVEMRVWLERANSALSRGGR